MVSSDGAHQRLWSLILAAARRKSLCHVHDVRVFQVGIRAGVLCARRRSRLLDVRRLLRSARRRRGRGFFTGSARMPAHPPRAAGRSPIFHRKHRMPIPGRRAARRRCHPPQAPDAGPNRRGFAIEVPVRGGAAGSDHPSPEIRQRRRVSVVGFVVPALEFLPCGVAAGAMRAEWLGAQFHFAARLAAPGGWAAPSFGGRRTEGTSYGFFASSAASAQLTVLFGALVATLHTPFCPITRSRIV
jgi:hypothetical protein